MNKYGKKTIILGLAIIVSVFVLLANLGYNIEPPFPLSVQTNDGRFVEPNQKNTVFEEGFGGVVFDSGLTRLIFLDKDKRATEIKPPTATSDSVIYYKDAVLLNNCIYVLSYEKYVNSGYIKNESITSYDINGNKQNVIYESKYDNFSSYTSKILTLKEVDSNLYAIYLDQSTNDLKVIDVFSEGKKTISATKAQTNDEIIAADYNITSNTAGIITNTNYLHIYKENNLIEESNSNSKYISILDDGSYCLEKLGNEALINLDIILFSPFLIFKTLLFWICLSFLIIISIIALIKGIKKLKRILLIVLIALCGLGLSGYYSINQLTSSIDNNINVLTVSALNAKTMIDKSNEIKIKDYNEYLTVKETLSELKKNNLDCGFNIDYVLFNHENNNYKNGYATCTTINDKMLNLDVVINNPLNFKIIKGDIESQDYEVFQYTDFSNTFLMCQHIIRDADNNIVGSLCTSTDIFLNNSYLTNTIWQTFAVLLIIVISIVLLIAEIFGLRQSVELKKKFIKNKIKNPEIAFNRIFSFLTTFVTSFDSALMVLIAKDMLEKNGSDNIAVLLGIPAMTLSIGMTVGKPIYNKMAKHINIKSVIIIISLCLGLSYVACFYCVMESNFYGYVIALFVSGVFTGALTGVKFYMPLLSPNDDIRFEINNNNSLTGISGNVLSIALAGMVASCFDSQYIYIMVLAPTICFAILGIFVFPRGVKYYKEENKKNNSNYVEVIKFIISPAFLSFALFMLMTDTIATGYKSFMFPLFTSEAGFTKADISNFVVFGNFLAFLINQNSKKIVKVIDFLPISIICTLITGLVFMSFTINNSILWATLVIAIIIVFAKISSMSNAMLWPRLCKAIDFPEQTCNKIIIYFNDFTYMIRSMILSSLLLLGITAACFWIGLYMLIGAIIFALFARKNGFKNIK